MDDEIDIKNEGACVKPVKTGYYVYTTNGRKALDFVIGMFLFFVILWVGSKLATAVYAGVFMFTELLSDGTMSGEIKGPLAGSLGVISEIVMFVAILRHFIKSGRKFVAIGIMSGLIILLLVGGPIYKIYAALSPLR